MEHQVRERKIEHDGQKDYTGHEFKGRGDCKRNEGGMHITTKGRMDGRTISKNHGEDRGGQKKHKKKMRA